MRFIRHGTNKSAVTKALTVLIPLNIDDMALVTAGISLNDFRGDHRRTDLIRQIFTIAINLVIMLAAPAPALAFFVTTALMSTPISPGGAARRRDAGP
jgi:hypothetical protein